MTDHTRNGVRAGRILIVDDEKAIREVIAAMLAPANYGCREAASGLEALAMLESGEEFDLMLTDLMMSDLDGIALLERSKDKYPLMPVVIVTAVQDISVALAAIRCGAQDYLTKPFEREQLLAVVRRALECRRAKLEHRAYVSSLESQVARLTEQLRGRIPEKK
jgi:DNA-binding NtrC family response regulator